MSTAKLRTSLILVDGERFRSGRADLVGMAHLRFYARPTVLGIYFTQFSTMLSMPMSSSGMKLRRNWHNTANLCRFDVEKVE